MSGLRYQALRLFDQLPEGDRRHVRIRWQTCPFSAVLRALPRAGRVLEIGCGHGLFSVLAALESPERDVLGIDVAPNKIEAATRMAPAARALGARLGFALTEPGALPDGPFDAIVILDVLYLLPPDDQRTLLLAAADRLAPGGRLVVKEVGLQPWWKFAWCAFQEFLAVRVLRITQGDELTYVSPHAMGHWLVDAGLTVLHRPLHAGYLHPHHLLVGSRSPGSAAPSGEHADLALAL